MAISDPASIFGRHEFVVRRLHSLTGLMPIGGYLAFHLATNAAIIDGPDAYQHRADQIHRLGPTTILFLGWSLIFLPILFHGLVGMLIVTRGKRNVGSYPHRENWRYTLQRASGVIAFVFILWHVFHMHGWFRFEWWVENVALPLGGAQFDPHHAAATAGAAIQAAWWVMAFYAVGVAASVYHLANGIWTMGITWGAWTSPRAQRWANYPCAAVGVGLMVVGLGALYSMATVDVPKIDAATNQARPEAIYDAPAPREGAATALQGL
jgi:succinate dehydrogenase / fumarate reductase cytochrome b subunit